MTKKREKQPRNLLDLPMVQDLIEVKKVNSAGRQRLEYGNMEELKLSITQKGLIQPIAVMEYEEPYEGYNHYLLAGGRRLQAFRELKIDMIPARIYPSDLNGFEIRSVELEENIRRKDMTDAERLKATKQLYDLWTEMYGEKKSTGKEAEGMSVRDAAKKLGISKSKMSEDLEMAKWVEEVPELEKLENVQEIRKAIKKAKKRVVVKKKLDAYEKDMEGKEEGEIKKVYEKAYIIGDFLDLVGNIPSGTIDLVDLDIDYPMDVEDNPMHQEVQQDKKFGAYKSIPRSDFPTVMKKTLAECYRVLKSDGWIIIWFGYEYFQDLQDWAKGVGFKTTWYHGKWYKGGGYGHTRNPYIFLNHTIEPFFYFRRGSPSISVPRTDVFEFHPLPPEKRSHPYEKPIDLMYSIMDTFIEPGSRILVPFAGSGNTLIAGWRLKCHGVGFDLSEEYKENYKLKVKELVL